MFHRLFATGYVTPLPRLQQRLHTQGFLELRAAMDSFRIEILCKNSTYGCIFASSSVANTSGHFHPLQYFTCSKMVPKMNFAEHYEQRYKDSSASPCPPPGETPYAAEAKASATIVSREEHFLRECVKDCTCGVESLSRVMNDVAGDVKAMKEKQEDLEAILKGHGVVIRELRKVIPTNAEKVNEVEQGVGTIVHRVEKVDSLLEEVRVLTRPLADDSRIDWYVENVSQRCQCLLPQFARIWKPDFFW